ncbi:MAG TPA: DUF58 domain-containing protein [Anaerolineales bacterium]|nr:DUF58 domain-containing protein [Anaerolineales bacterium]
MSRAFTLGTLILLLVLAGLASLHGALLALTLPLLVYFLYALLVAPERMDLDVRRELAMERVSPGTPVKVQVTVLNRGPALDELALEDVVSLDLVVTDGSPRHFISLAGGASFSFAYTVQGPRGGFPFERVHAVGGDALGLVALVRDLQVFGQLFVLPSISRIRQVPIRPRRTRVYAGSIPARVGGAGVEFFGVRNYEPGDTPRRINWRVSARHPDALYSNEFQQERVADVGIVLDGRERSNLFSGGRSIFEYSVSAAGALADAFLTQGNRVGLLIYSRYLQWTIPGYGKLQRERILHALAGASPGASQIFDGLQYLPTRVFPGESQIVLVSPLVEDDFTTLIQLRARGYQILVVVPDPVSFEQAYLLEGHSRYASGDIDLAARVVRMERRLMLSRLQRAGIQATEWDVSQPFDLAMRRASAWRMQAGIRL